MIKNFFIVAWRNLLRRKSFSFINITGLAIGMAAAILILLWIENEMNFDRFYANENRLYEVWNSYKQEGRTNCWNITSQPMAKAIQDDYPEVERTVRVHHSFPMLLARDEKRISARGNIVDSGFLQLFSFPILKGDRNTALNDMHSVVLTENLAVKIFGTENPVGKTVKIDNRDNFTVTAVMKDRPSNSRFDFEFLVPISYLRKMGFTDEENWSNNSVNTYVMLRPNASLVSIEPKLKHIRRKYDKNDPEMETFLYPVSRAYLHGNFENGREAGGRIEIVRLFAIIAAFILLIACINFMNLSTARSEQRAREVGVRKVMGAQRGSLVRQFLGESILLAFISGLLALVIVRYSLPAFNELVGKKLSLDFTNGKYWLAASVFILFTGVLAGSYPALYLSSFRPVNVLKGVLKAGNALVTPRKILVIGQFAFAIILIIATIVVKEQINNAQKRQSGYKKENLVFHYMEGDVEKNYMLIKQELMSSGIAISVTKTSAPITEGWSNTWQIAWEGKDPNDKTVIDRFCADDAMAKTTGLQILQGRDFDLTNYPTDSNAVLVNESAVKLMGFKEPIGKTIKDMGQEWHVVGVFKDIILKSPYRPVEPMVIAGAKGWFNVIHMRLGDKFSTAENVEALKKIFKKYNPEYELNYRFVDEEYARKFNDEKRTSKLATLFAMLTIIISCLGLFGLASYMAENRVKEIGVRKVLGASVKNIALLLSKDFLKLVLAAFVVASPLAYWAMHSWLQQFPYRVGIEWWVFVLTGAIALLIALITVSYQAIRAAVTNPVKSLRSE